MISGRDTKNPTQLTWERNLGGAKLSSQECGYGIDSAAHGGATQLQLHPGFSHLTPRLLSRHFQELSGTFRGFQGLSGAFRGFQGLSALETKV